MLIDETAYGNRLRNAAPAEKAGFAALCLLASLVAKSLVVPALVAATTTLAALALARIPARTWMKLCLLPVGFLLTGGLSLALEVGSSIHMAWSLPIAEGVRIGMAPAGLRLAAHVTARSLGCTSAMLFLAATTPLTDLIQLLRRARVPGLVLELLTITYRALFVLLETSAQMQRAQASRLGYSTLRTSLGSLGTMASRLFGCSLERAEQSWRAMLSRGYDEELKILPAEHVPSPGRAFAAAGTGLGLLALALFLPRGW